YQYTSTNVFGRCKMDDITTITSELKEIIVNCCADDVKLNQPTDETLVIFDMSFGPYVFGYVEQDSQTKVPIEFATVTGLDSQVVTPDFTDHNGFYFGASAGQYTAILISVDSCDTTVHLIAGNQGNYTHTDFDVYNPGQFPANGIRTIEGNVKTCDGTIGIAGVSVIPLGARPVQTDSTGHFKVLLHQRAGATLPPDDEFFLSQSGSCVIVDCADQCVKCFEHKNVTYKPCADNPPPGRDTTIPDWNANILGNLKGPKNGGKYGLGFVMHDFMGRHGFVQANESDYITLQSINETHSFGFSTINFAINPSLVFPSWVKYITFVATANLNEDDYLSWVAERVEFIDSGGNVNSSAPVKIRIYYESLNEYNKQAGYATNTNWQFLVNSNDGTKQVSRAGDRVQFILNGDGNFFANNVTLQVTYDLEGKYFDVNYTDDLKDIKDGALIQLIRPKDCLTQNLYYETCSTVRIINGKPEVYSGTINLYDSYFLNREIPIPKYETQADGTVKRTVIATYFSFFFEHPSPSDYWGDHCANRGRIFVKNPYERQKQFGSEIARSKALLNNSNFNGLSYFADEDVKEFAEQEWGNIVVAIMEVNTVLVICEYNNFFVGFNDNIPSVNENNQLVINSTENQFGLPQRKIGSDYGCQPKDINTIRKLQGKVIYLDRNKFSLVQHNFQQAVDISMGGYKGYLTAKIRFANDRSQPRNFNMLFIGGINPKNNEYLLTTFKQSAFSDQPSTQYINDAPGVQVGSGETLIIDYMTGMSKAFAAYTPEYYGTLSGFNQNRAFLSVRQGEAWIHSSNSYNIFFGTQCKKTLQLVTNLSPETVKRYLYMEVYCKQHKFVAQQVTTESGQQSRVLANYWAFRGKFWSAPFLCDLNTYPDPNQPIIAVAPLTDGNVLYGRWIKVTYQSEDADDGKYCELDGIVTYLNPYEKSAD
ncbi:MAG TPA: hypothetical protein VFS31_10690, partial [Chitinophagaceae bacterium]|nr:hypothetical protein [Chitinophagaceae bacterium]